MTYGIAKKKKKKKRPQPTVVWSTLQVPEKDGTTTVSSGSNLKYNAINTKPVYKEGH